MGTLLRFALAALKDIDAALFPAPRSSAVRPACITIHTATGTKTKRRAV